MAAPLSLTLVLGEASESDSEPEPEGGAAGTPAAGLKVPGEASETEEEEEEDSAARVPLPGVSRGGPSLLQQRLGAGEGRLGRLRGAMAEALGGSFGGAARLLEGLGGPLGQAPAGAAATAHCLCLVRRDLRAVSATVATITACHLLPDICGEL
ncbi:LOW QUALITY PROTEIN: biogenesis of lysosome-related organelles complex 1 subunit 3-like [Phasianus colchicus]|uniref:LOW QUALITY PROTEIN: biogenesis of lysosome-related organelles complex 1 subunit 3-like n=1 Tax=Phasianus colchicus TaxID=9054 RepID=UPI00129D2346|nr:LOW QUALITY PROTEIN: biogenesis of lysosome-related organelles complex 1 subunit 3-like [Phasianus colchicus]